MAGIALVPTAWMIYPLVGIAACGSSLSIPAISGMLSSRVPSNEQGRLMGGNQVLFSLTAILGPAVAGISFERIGISAPYWIGCGLALVALYFAVQDAWLTADPLT
jgi:DHA1 family tetracycline resistance protein-like MFS transporter